MILRQFAVSGPNEILLIDFNSDHNVNLNIQLLYPQEYKIQAESSQMSYICSVLACKNVNDPQITVYVCKLLRSRRLIKIALSKIIREPFNDNELHTFR